MARGGARIGAGRKKDPKIALIKEFTAAIKKGELMLREECTGDLDPNFMPMDHFLKVMRHPSEPKDRRDRAAAVLLPFCHAKAGETGKKGAKKDAADNASTGKFGMSRAPSLKALN